MPRSFLALCFAGIIALAAGYDLYISLKPEAFFFYTNSQVERLQYASSHVVVTISSILISGLVTIVALFYQRLWCLWLRSAVILIVLVPWAYFSLMGAGHGPEYVHFHALWALFLVLVVAFAGLGSFITFVCHTIWPRTKRAV